MIWSLIAIEVQPKDINVVNLDEDSSKVLQKNSTSSKYNPWIHVFP
jgi:hypothetical protein